jgi:hypothetical protein
MDGLKEMLMRSATRDVQDVMVSGAFRGSLEFE